MTESSARRPLDQVIRNVASALKEEGPLSSGDRASLRRQTPTDYGSPGFWKVMVGIVDSPTIHSSGDWRPDDSERERRWGAILQAMAIHNDAFLPTTRFGQTLALAKVTEARLHKLLRAKGNRLIDEVRTVARFLKAKNEPVNWIELAVLVLNQQNAQAECLRRKVARDYYFEAQKRR